MRVALVHYWLVAMRGGERVLQELMSLYPDADVLTNVYRPERTGQLFIGRSPPHTTAIDRLPFARSHYPMYLPLMPGALEAVDMSGYDLVISSESGPAKWVIPYPNARHVCYVHSPMRYLWDQRHLYRAKLPLPARPLFDHVTGDLRNKDVISAARVDDFVANSTFVAARIKRYYNRDATVIHPPVSVGDFGAPQAPEDYYLYAGQLVSYKNVRAAVDACVALGRRLVVVGDGPERRYVEKFADQGIEYRGRVSRAEMVTLMQRCRALLFPGVEDFGIVPVEVLAAGRPVVALGRGGILDTVTDGTTGILYEPTNGIRQAIRDFEEWLPDFRTEDAQRSAHNFGPNVFRSKWRDLVHGSQVTPAVRSADFAVA